MKKFWLSYLLICLFALFGCSGNDVSAELSNQAGLIDKMVTAGVFDRNFTCIELPGKSGSSLPETSVYQIDEGTLLFAQEREGNDSNGSYNDIDTQFCLYNLTNDCIIDQLLISDAYHSVTVRDNKILIKSATDFYSIDFDLQHISEKFSLPESMFDNLCDYCRNDPAYDISYDLRYILYSCAENGMFLYDRETGENRQLFAGKSFPYYQIDTDFWESPYKMFFLPNNKQIAVVAANQEAKQNGLWVFDFDGKLQGFVDAEEFGDVSDLSSWDNAKLVPQPFTRTDRYSDNGNYRAQSYVHKVDFQNQTVDAWRKLDCPADTLIQAFNEKYFAYVERHSDNDIESTDIVVVDYATLTPRSVLRANNSWLKIAGVTNDGRVLFVWAPDIDSEYFEEGLFLTCLTDRIE